MIAWLATLSAGAADCPEPATFQALSSAILDAERAVRTSDRDALERAEALAERRLVCLDSTLRPADVASFMRLKGLALFVRKDRERASAWFAAARSVEPSYSLPEALIPERHPIRRAFEEAALRGSGFTKVPRPQEGAVAINGRSAAELPEGMPWVLQWFDVGGDVRVTSFGEDEPDAWPYPLRFERGRGQAVLSAAFQLAPSPSRGDLRAGLIATGLFELGGPIALEAGLRASVAPVRVDDETQARLVPGIHAGARAWFRAAGLRSFAGASFLVTSHDDRVIAPGGFATTGVRLGSRRRFVDVGLEVGYSRDPYGQLQVGVGLGR